MTRLALLSLLIGLGGCGSAPSAPSSPGAIPRPVVPERARTAGDELLALAPEGADVAVELDIARLRDNPVISPLLRGLAGAGVHVIGDVDGQLPVDLSVLQQADTVVLCAYHVGEDRATTITLVRGPTPLGTRIDRRTHVLGPPEWIARVLRVHAGTEPSLVDDLQFMSVRTRAMPRRAEGAFFRVSARLDFDARVELANKFDLDIAPATLSVWADVADDLAVVSTMRGAVPAEGDSLRRALVRGRDRLAQVPWVRARYLHFTVRGTDITVSDGNARVVLIIGPRRLQNMINRLARMFGIEVRASAHSPGHASLHILRHVL